MAYTPTTPYSITKIRDWFEATLGADMAEAHRFINRALDAKVLVIAQHPKEPIHFTIPSRERFIFWTKIQGGYRH